MLSGLTLRGYRSFDVYRMTGVARVNLVVGRNNCGKTSILEAIQLLVSGDPSALRESALRRNELTDHGADLSHVFYGHASAPGTRFELSGHDDRPQLTARISLPDGASDAVLPGYDHQLSIIHSDTARSSLPVTENGVLANVILPEMPPKARFLDCHPRSMHPIWNSVLAESRGTQIVEALQLLEPEIDKIVYPTGGSSRRSVELGYRDSDRRLPIGSYGDGMRRLLALSLALIGTDECVLIDEIDTGLHWTVMEDMWRLVIETARRSNVQVFATTHSYDCIRGLGSLVQSRPDLADDLAIHKMHRSLAQSVRIPGTAVAVAVEQDIEVR